MNKSDSLIILGSQYLNVSELLLKGLIDSGNVWFATDDYESYEKTLDNYKEKTRYSDFNILVPTLFNFYHGLELTLKALIYLEDSGYSGNTHSIHAIYSKFEALYNDNELIARYINWNKIPDLLKDFLSSNGFSSVDDLYQSLRYSLDTDFDKVWDYSSLRFKEETGKKFAEEFYDSMDELRKLLIALYRTTKKGTSPK